MSLHCLWQFKQSCLNYLTCSKCSYHVLVCWECWDQQCLACSNMICVCNIINISNEGINLFYLYFLLPQWWDSNKNPISFGEQHFALNYPCVDKCKMLCSKGHLAGVNLAVEEKGHQQRQSWHWKRKVIGRAKCGH